MLGSAPEFRSTIATDDIDVIEKQPQASNAFKEHNKGKLKIIPVQEGNQIKRYLYYTIQVIGKR